MNIRLTDPAKKDYEEILEQLLKRWTEREHDRFIDAVDELMDVLKVHPKAFRMSDYRNVRLVPVVPQVSVFYHIDEQTGTIWIMRFWMNRKNPENFKLK